MAWSPHSLIVFCLLQGFGAGAIAPTTMAVIFRVFPPEQRGLALGINSLGWTFGPILGPMLGGYLTEMVSWRMIFSINVPIRIIGVGMAVTIMAADLSDRRSRRLDLLGLVTMATGVVTLLLANLSKGKLGEDVSALLGALLITGLEQAALGRVEIPEEERRDFYLYVDEAHTFQTLSLADLLPEARKFRLNLILVHQYLEEVDEQVRAAIFGNVGTLIAFRVGARDAEYLAQEFFPIFTMEDFQNLPPYAIYLKPMVDGVMSRGFSARTLPPEWPELA